MANNHSTLTGLFTDIADAIREKTGGTETIIADNFPEVIAAIDTQEDLDPELATQDDLIAQIATALEGKMGVSIETCTIELDNEYVQPYDYTNGNLELVHVTQPDMQETITVLKNTIMRCYGKVESYSGGITYQETIGAGDVYISIIFVTGDGSLSITDDYIIE